MGGGKRRGAWVRLRVRRWLRRWGESWVREGGEREEAWGVGGREGARCGGCGLGGGLVWGVSLRGVVGATDGLAVGGLEVRGRVKAARSRASGKGWTMMSDEGCSHAWKREEECPSSVVWQLKIFCPALKRPCVTKANRHSGRV